MWSIAKKLKSVWLGSDGWPNKLVFVSSFSYLSDVKFLQPVHKGSEKGRHLRLQGMT